MPKLQKIPLTSAGLALALFLFLTISYISYQSTLQFADSARWVSHTYNVINRLNAVQSEIKGAEASQRGYLLTGDESHLRLYEDTLVNIPRLLKQLKEVTTDNPAQQREIVILENLIHQKTQIMQQTIELNKNPQLAAMAMYELIGQGKFRMDQIRQQVQHMTSSEENLLKVRAQQEQTNAHLTRVWILIGNLSAIALLLFSFWLLRQEVNSRKKLQSQAELHAAEIEDLYNNAPCAYHSVDKNGLVIRMNDTALKWLGYTREEVLNKKFHPDLMTPHSANRFYNEVFPLFKSQGFLKDIEFDYMRKNGTVFNASLNASVVYDSMGNYLYSRTSFYDISERKQDEGKIRNLNQELAQKASELEVTNKELESFTYSVSHDLRSPLRAIDGYAHMFQEDFADRLDEESSRLLTTIRANSKKMGNLIDDLLAFSHLGRKPVETSEVDMNNLVREVWHTLEISKEKTPAKFISGLLPPVWGDPSLLRQVMLNLLSNAAKYSSKREEATVEVSAIEQSEEIIYSVRDNGVGFNMKYYNKLFGVFQRLHRDDEFPGTGVGLAIVERIVCRHGGRVWAESVMGEGSIFSFSLPKRNIV